MTDRVPSFLRALGRRPLPGAISLGSVEYSLVQVFKNDFFAVTALYAGAGGEVLLKVNRQAWLFFLPMRWAGRWLARRECAALERLAGLEGIPRLLARFESTGLIREFVPGHPLAKGERVHDEFHSRLRELVAAIHARAVAVVDLEKCENVLVGEDGRPYLFDFQIAWLTPRWGGEHWPLTALRRWLQNGDRYHLVKLQRRTRPDQLSAEVLAASYRRPWYIRVFRAATWPWLWLRRAILDRIDPRRAGKERGRVS